MSLQEPGERLFVRNGNIGYFIHEIGFERYPLFLVGLAYDMEGDPMRANAVATRDGDVLGFDSGYGLELEGRTPFPAIMDGEDWETLDGEEQLRALGRLNIGYFCHELAKHTRGYRSINEMALSLLRTWFNEDTDFRPIHDAAVLGAWPVEITPAVTEAIRDAGERHDRELATRVLDYVSKPADTES
jgi:hypothetical protein